ncbi:DUF3575 domain-containing protein [Soonwooa sp.]|uniref:DUF3575 domain-containing protein n=1 Tax=Soonwooa sp. TaxID=1938592 RepID=UPI00261DCB06|nr:DUF3575 domain-containing protein [Soonwooa sp.]
MKTKILLASLLATSLVYAQNSGGDSENKNTIKTNLTAYAFRNLNITYERSINKNIAVNATLAVIPQGGLPFMNTFFNERDREDIGTIKMGNTSFTLEGRYYFGKKYNSGFYLAPYYRYTNMKFDEFHYNYLVYKDSNNNEVDNPLDMNGSISAHSFGLMIGAQWLFGTSQNWVLDWWIVGGHYGFASGNLDGKSRYTMTPSQQAELQDEINTLDIPIIKHEAHINATGGSIKLDGPWAGLRSGISFGYRF